MNGADVVPATVPVFPVTRDDEDGAVETVPVLPTAPVLPVVAKPEVLVVVM